MPRDNLLGERFKIKKWKWYVVDFRNLHDPVIIRKHFETRQQAITFRRKYYDTKHFDVITWKTAEGYGLRDYPSRSKRHHKIHTAKYDYPPECITRIQKQNFRNNERKKMKQKIRLPKVTETAVWEILDDRPVLFIKRLQYYRDNHWAFSDPVEGLNEFKKRYEWPAPIRHLCNIVRVLQEYYDLGLYDMAEVAMFIYKKWGERISRHCDNVRAIPQDHVKIIKEFKARGFVEKSSLNFTEDESWVESILIKPRLAHPEVCYHAIKDKNLYDFYIYDFQAGYGIPGYTRSHVAGLEKRK